MQLIHIQTRGVIWKWDVLDSSKDYPALISDDFIPNYPAIWQKLSNIENIINLINYANVWRNLKTKCMLHNYSLYSMDLWRNHLNPLSGCRGVARKRNSAPNLPWKNRAHSYANEAEYEKLILVNVIVNHQKYLPESIEMIAPVIIELLAKYIKKIIAIIMQMS
jgi:hypothetical protein